MRLAHAIALTSGIALASAGAIPAPDVLWDFTAGVETPALGLTRGSTGTYVAQDGSIQTAAINAPRYDWTGGVRALLVEPSATNLLRYTNDLLNAAWAKDAGAAWSYQSGVIPSRSVWMLTAATTGSGWTGQTINTTGSSVMSARVKRGTARYVYLQASDSTNAGFRASWFDLEAGVSAQENIVAGGSPVGITLGAVVGIYEGDGVWRLSAVVTGNSRFMGLGFSASGGARTQAVGQTGYLWDPQIEYGGAATSHIPTDGAAVTRAADVIAPLSMSAIWAAAGLVGGTIVADVEASGPNSTARGHIWAVDDAGTDALAARAYLGGSADDRSVLTVGNGSTSSDLLVTSALRGRQRIAVAYANGTQPLVSRNGGAVQTHPLAYAHNAANTTLQSLFSGFNGRIRSLAIYRAPADAALLQRMSAL